MHHVGFEETAPESQGRRDRPRRPRDYCAQVRRGSRPLGMGSGSGRRTVSGRGGGNPWPTLSLDSRPAT